MSEYKTPGVYIEEISTFPPSVAEVETAIPAFFGFTEKGPLNQPTRISSMLEYEALFGNAEPEKEVSASLIKTKDGTTLSQVYVDKTKRSKNVLYYAMQLFYANGGGVCYITSTGYYGNDTSIDVYNNALNVLRKEDEPTLLVFPDAPYNLSQTNYYALMNSALMQCKDLGDRFAIIDVIEETDLQKSMASMRSGIISTSDFTKYGAAYFPSLNTVLNYRLDIDVTIAQNNDIVTKVDNAKQLRLDANNAKSDVDKASVVFEKAKKASDAITPPDTDAVAKMNAAKSDLDAKTAKFNALEAEAKAAEAIVNALTSSDVEMKKITDLPNLLQKQIMQQAGDLTLELTPCAAIAGVYCSVDNNRGVWKAPANVGLNYVSSLTMKINDEDQKDMNIDVDGGKSINAIRAFSGQGIKVWGARTLDGNDNEWRYISVRRFFNMVEESVKKSTSWAVFEPNDSNTWVKVRAMIENYLMLKWRDGALAGAKPNDAYYVRVGLGQTMTSTDVLEGRMIVEIGMAVVRPAEFIVLQFSHKLQVS